ncbi:MAG: hypothetical protein LBV68_02395 [Spirochaetaceae bacterium]|jgi:hypothetical protein|nr:hypothetical protein [Spirochaetaceae bacterium]
MGSSAWRTGSKFAGLDDISLIYPSYDTYLDINVPSRNLIKSGNFYDIMFETNYIKKGFQENSYCVYPYFQNGLVMFKNEEAQNEEAPVDKKILLTSDSFGMTLAPYLALQTKNMNFFFGANINLKAYSKDFNPDIIIMLYYPPSIASYINSLSAQFE